MRAVAAVELGVVGLALLLGACSGPPRVLHRTEAKASGPEIADIPLVNCEDVDLGTPPRFGIRRIRFRGLYGHGGYGTACPRFGFFIQELLNTKTLRRLSGCSDCELIREDSVELFQADVFVGGRVFPSRDYAWHAIVNDLKFPVNRYGVLLIQSATFTFRHREKLRQRGRLDYRCPLDDPNDYDESCVEFRSLPPGQTNWGDR